MNLQKDNKLAVFCAMIVTAVALFPVLLSAQIYPVRQEMDNGITVNLYSSELILATMVWRDDYGRLVFHPSGHAGYSLVEDITDPSVRNKGDGAFHPMREKAVLSAVESIDFEGAAVSIEIDIYLLPMPRRYITTSSACGNMIFLSPGVFELSDEFTAFTVTHEIGHCMQSRFMPDSDVNGWDRYLYLRGILGDPEYSDDSDHMNRPKEIFAEDFRYLFGSELSKVSGGIENGSLPLPVEVAGLERFFKSLISTAVAFSDESLPGSRIVSASNYPNPFNPSTMIRASFDLQGGSVPVEVKIYNVKGELVRDLYGGDVAEPEIDLAWDGTSDSGDKVGSGIYFYAVRSENYLRTGKMLLVR
ncbi:MAG: hypothetical protein JW814_08380 [Candidatus Krumholzibacteriota bacterium]|nr:hypothetical protein [Candidatus Krumholzibacteriota bacterium]